MEYVIIVINSVIFFVFGYCINLRIKKEKTVLANKTENERTKRIKKAFESLMDYDYEKALAGDKHE